MKEGFALAVAFVVVLVVTLAAGGPWISLLRRLALQHHAYEDAPKSHAKKTGTPTMGGALFAIGFVASILVTPAFGYISVGGLALVMLGFGCGAVGALDDLRSIRAGRNRGLRAREKLLLTAVVGVAFLQLVNGWLPPQTRDALWRSGGATLIVPHGLWYGVALLAVLGTTHAVNLTDGLDGLASGTMLPPLLLFAVLAWQNAAYGVCVVDVTVAASVLGFLAFNRYPARVIMGDTGALALGAVLAGSAVLTGNVLLLPLVGGVFAAEAVSVMAQVAYFKTTRKRIFRMAPLHHHFELADWPETKVTSRFWAASALLSLAGAALAR